MVSCFDLNWKLLALLWEPVSHAQKRMMSLPRVPQALVNIRNGYPDTHGCSPFLLIFPVPTNDLPWKHLRCTPPWYHGVSTHKGCFWVVYAGTWRYPGDPWRSMKCIDDPATDPWSTSSQLTQHPDPSSASQMEIPTCHQWSPAQRSSVPRHHRIVPGWPRVPRYLVASGEPHPATDLIHRNPIVPMNLGCWWYWFEINFYRNHHFFFFQRKVSGFRALCFSGKNSWDRTVILQLSQVKTGLHFCWAWSPTSAIDVFPSWQGTTRAYFSTVHRDMAEGFNILKKAYEFVRRSATGVGGTHRPSILTGKNHSIIYRVIQHLSHFELSFGREPPKKCTSPTWPGSQAISCTGGRYGRVFVDDRRCSHLVADEWEVGACSCLAGWWF